MFWSSIAGGFSLLVDSKILAGILILLLADRLIVRARFTNQGKGGGKVLSQLRESGAQLLLHAIMLALFVAFLHPTMLRRDAVASVGDVASATTAIVVSAVVAAVIVFLVCLVPYVGTLIYNIWSVKLFLEAVLIWRFLLGGIAGLRMTTAPSVQTFPGVAGSLAYVAIALLLGGVVLIGILVMTAKYPAEKRSRALGVIQNIIVWICWSLALFLPFLMYADHTRQLMQHG